MPFNEHLCNERHRLNETEHSNLWKAINQMKTLVVVAMATVIFEVGFYLITKFVH